MSLFFKHSIWVHALEHIAMGRQLRP